MPAITGDYRPVNRLYREWASQWVVHRNWGRKQLAGDLRHIRQKDGSCEGIEYRNYLLWLGCYPVKEE